jgi:hypothetical protein
LPGARIGDAPAVRSKRHLFMRPMRRALPAGAHSALHSERREAGGLTILLGRDAAREAALKQGKMIADSLLLALADPKPAAPARAGRSVAPNPAVSLSEAGRAIAAGRSTRPGRCSARR